MSYVNPSEKLLTEMAKLSKYELNILLKNYKYFIDNVKIKDKIKQEKIDEQRKKFNIL